MKPKKPMGSLSSKGNQNGSRSSRSRGGGFERLDPSKMGFAMPEWMETPTHHEEPEGTRLDGPVPPELGTDESSAEEMFRPRDEPETRSVVEGMKVVCICKGIKKRVFWKVLDAGICTHSDINRHTGSGSGNCQGRRCGPRILDMLKRLSR